MPGSDDPDVGQRMNQPAIRRLKLLIEYDGTDFSGWQFQPHRRTVQGELEQALSGLIPPSLDAIAQQGGEILSRIIGAGRTDAGVHALGQVAHVDIKSNLPGEVILKGMNRLMQRDVRILAVDEAPPGFHARFSAKSRSYRYRLLHRDSALERRTAWAPKFKWDNGLIINALAHLAGEHSFKSFCRARPGENAYICRVFAASWESDDQSATFQITADRFLHAMVRGIVGALLDVGRGYRSIAGFRQLLDHPDRIGAVQTAPAQGLTLMRVEY